MQFSEALFPQIFPPVEEGEDPAMTGDFATDATPPREERLRPEATMARGGARRGIDRATDGPAAHVLFEPSGLHEATCGDSSRR